MHSPKNIILRLCQAPNTIYLGHAGSQTQYIGATPSPKHNWFSRSVFKKITFLSLTPVLSCDITDVHKFSQSPISSFCNSSCIKIIVNNVISISISIQYPVSWDLCPVSCVLCPVSYVLCQCQCYYLRELNSQLTRYNNLKINPY